MPVPLNRSSLSIAANRFLIYTSSLKNRGYSEASTAIVDWGIQNGDELLQEITTSFDWLENNIYRRFTDTTPFLVAFSLCVLSFLFWTATGVDEHNALSSGQRADWKERGHAKIGELSGDSLLEMLFACIQPPEMVVGVLADALGHDMPSLPPVPASNLYSFMKRLLWPTEPSNNLWYEWEQALGVLLPRTDAISSHSGLEPGHASSSVQSAQDPSVTTSVSTSSYRIRKASSYSTRSSTPPRLKNVPDPLPCEECGRDFHGRDRKTNLKRHQRIHTPAHRVVCADCGEHVTGPNLGRHKKKSCQGKKIGATSEKDP